MTNHTAYASIANIKVNINMSLEIPNPEQNSLAVETQTVQNMYEQLAQFNMNPNNNPAIIDREIARLSETNISYQDQEVNPSFGLAIEAIAAGSMRTAELGQQFDGRVIARLQAQNADPAIMNRLAGLMAGSREARTYPGGDETLSAECANISQNWLRDLTEDNDLQPQTRSAMATTILFASQAATPESGVGAMVRPHLVKLYELMQ